MTNPTTEPTQSIRERVENALCRALPIFGPDQQVNAAKALDAILDELNEPSGDQCILGAAAVHPHMSDSNAYEVWQAMLQHIRDGGQ